MDLPIIYLLAAATFVSTIAGGLVALRFRESQHYFFAFAAGSLVAVSFLDLIPESLSLAADQGVAPRHVFLVLLASFFLYSIIERAFGHHHHHGAEEAGEHGHIMGPIGASSLVLHSFVDGVAIGVAFQVSAAVGAIVAIAVLFHDFTDGLNTVTLMLKNRHGAPAAKRFLLADAAAPVLGVAVTAVVGLPADALPLLLAFFAGEFLYFGASHLLPETYEHGRSVGMIAMLALGMAVIAFVTGVAAI